MGVNAILPDLNRDLEHLGGEVVYLNDLDPIKDHELIKRLTISIFDGASFSLIPSCSCGMTSLASNPELEIGDRRKSIFNLHKSSNRSCGFGHQMKMVNSSRFISWIS